MDAIGPEIRLTLAPGKDDEIEAEARDWRYDPHSETVLHRPTRMLFHLYVDRHAVGGRRASMSTFSEIDLRTRLVRVTDGFPVPGPQEIAALGRAAIRWFINCAGPAL